MQIIPVLSLPAEPDASRPEEKRLEVLRSYGLLDTPAEAELDALTRLAAYICGSPIALITLLDDQRQWFKSKQGLEIDQTPRSSSFCRYTIRLDGVFEVPDALADERFRETPLVVGPPFIRHYCGAPLITPGGYRLGSLCVIDSKPKKLTEAQKEALQTLAGEVMVRLELKRQQEQLRQQKQSAEYSEKQFKALFENSRGYLYTHSLSGEILSVNVAAEQAMQYGKPEAIGRNITDFLVADKPGAFEDYLRDLRAAGVRSGIVKVRTAAGEERYWQYRNVLCADLTREPFVICSAHDVTEKEVAQRILRQAEEELKSQVQLRTAELSAVNAALESTREELEDFLYRASHDLRGPVCSLRGIMHLMRREGAADNQEALMGMMEQTMLKLEHAMESILHYTNNRHNYLDCEKIDFSGVIGQAIEYGRRVKGFERVRIEADIEAACPFYSDAYRVQLVIQQLLANSIAFQDLTIPDPFVRISLTTDPAKVTICLEDNGVGVPPRTVPLIFDRFVKASGQSTGSGLGLYIVKEVLTKLGGTVEVTSIEGKGTCFVVEIPNLPPPQA